LRPQSRIRREPVVNQGTTFVGIDAHKAKLVVAVLPPDGPLIELACANTEKEVRRLGRRLIEQANGGEVRVCYEAGPTGYGLKRTLELEPLVCEVVAPSLIPRAAGNRVKTDRRDARKLAELLRAKLLTEVRAPTPEEESVRELCRARIRAKEQSTKARNRLGKMLLRHGRIYEGRAWTEGFDAWLNAQEFQHPETQLVFEDLRAECEHAESRVRRLDAHIEAVAQREAYAPLVGALCCLRGVRVLTAMVFLSEMHGIERFTNPRALMAYLGLTPSEHSSGGRQSRGAITKTGNRFVRRVLVEAAHHARRPARESKTLAARRRGQPAHIVAIARRAQDRLRRRYWRLVDRGKAPNKAVVAVARELVGFMWALVNATGLRAQS